MKNNIFAKLPSAFYTKMKAQKFVQNPQLLHFNDIVGSLVNIERTEFEKNLKKYIEAEIEGFEPLAMTYAGHQFGHFVSRLGDGRALLLAQIIGEDKKLYDLQLKGSGLTPYSRMGDGRAVLRSSIREYLCGEAMHNLGIKTTRALALIKTNEDVQREEIEPGAMILRVARSHIRFGHFEYFYYSNQHEALKILVDHVIENYFSHLKNSKNKYHQFLQEVVKATATTIAQWQACGFCHGVMNTDNMSILGDTLDYGPFGFLENYDPTWICNHSDYSGRYAYDQQPQVAAWNIYALCFALQPIISLEESAKIAQEFLKIYEETYANLMRQKIGLQDKKSDGVWQNLLIIMQQEKTDYTLTFSNLTKAVEGDESSFLELFDKKEIAQKWLKNYLEIIKEFSVQKDALQLMQKTNPRYILRNWLLQNVIEDVQEKGDMSSFVEIFAMIKNPFTENKNYEKYAKTAPQKYQDLCVSCSS